MFYSKHNGFKLNEESKLIAADLYHHRSFNSGYKIKFKQGINIVSVQLKEKYHIIIAHIVHKINE